METLKLPQDLYWGAKTEPLSPMSDDQLFPSISLFSPKLESEADEDAEDVLFDSDTEQLIASALMEGEIIIQFDENGQWDCIQGGGVTNYQSHITSIPITNLKESTSENLIQIPSPEVGYQTDNINFPINSFLYSQQQPIQQVQFPQQTKIDYPSFLLDLNSPNYLKAETTQTSVPLVSVNQDELCNTPPTSPTTSSTSAYDAESSESERGDEIVDEILRNLSKNLPDFTNDNDSQYSTSSFCSEDNTSNSDGCMSPTSSQNEYSMNTSDEYSSQDNLSNSSLTSGIDGLNVGSTTGHSKKRSRLYVRNVDEKKSRKKEQNKNAATRYRQKKKMEMKLDLDEENVLLEKNASLKKTVEDCQREVKYLKKLIREFYKNDKK